MTYVVPENPDVSLPENRFQFEVAGKVLSIPKVQYIPLDVLEDADREKKMIGIGFLLEKYGEKGQSALLKKLSPLQSANLTKAWQVESASGVDLGESSASTD